MRLSYLALVLVLVVTRAPAELANNELKIIHINVGQGDATLIVGPADAAGERVFVLMDAGDIPTGGDPDGGDIVGKVLADHEIKELDFFIASRVEAGLQFADDDFAGRASADGPTGGPTVAGTVR